MSRFYHTNDDPATPKPRQLRPDRPNPWHDQGEEVERLVIAARAEIARNPGALSRLTSSPVAHVVCGILNDLDLDFEDECGSLAARVVEGVLADRVVRRMLANHGLHSGDAAPMRRPGT